jgi:hypothetical protein
MIYFLLRLTTEAHDSFPRYFLVFRCARSENPPCPKGCIHFVPLVESIEFLADRFGRLFNNVNKAVSFQPNKQGVNRAFGNALEAEGINRFTFS